MSKGKQTVAHATPLQKKQKTTDVETNSLNCKYCNISFTRKDNLKRHYFKKHDN